MSTPHFIKFISYLFLCFCRIIFILKEDPLSSLGDNKCEFKGIFYSVVEQFSLIEKTLLAEKIVINLCNILFLLVSLY